jgi:Ca2+-binding EF-hand superfamily protein
MSLKKSKGTEAQAAMEELFNKFDPLRDGSGALTIVEFQKLLQFQGIDLSKKEVKSLFRQNDTSGGDGSKLSIRFDAFEYMYEKAKTRAGFKAGAQGVRDKRQFLRTVHDEFKEINYRGEQGVTKEGLLDIARILGLPAEKRDVDQYFKQYCTTEYDALPLGDITKFTEMINGKMEIKELAMDLADDFRTNTAFQQKLYEHFDSSKEGAMTKDDLAAVMAFLPTLVEVEANQKTIDKLMKKTVEQAKGGKITVDGFYEFFTQMKNMSDTKEIVDDFDNSDTPKTVFGGMVAASAFTVGVGLITLGSPLMWNATVLVIAGGVSLLFSIYIGLYTAGFSVSLCGESKGAPGAPSQTPGQIASIFFALAGASYGYGLFAGMQSWLEQITMLWLALGAAFLSCRCAAYLPSVGHFFRNPTEITDKDLEGYKDPDEAKAKYKAGQDKSPAGSPKSPSSPKSRKSRKSTEFNGDAVDLEAGIPGEVAANGAERDITSPKLKSRSSSIRPIASPDGDRPRSKGADPTSPYSSKSRASRSGGE